MSAVAQSKAVSDIPFFQYWDKNVPPAVAELLDAMRESNREFAYRCYSDAEAADFIRDEFGEQALKLYRVCGIPAMRADLFRYYYLVRCGGLYIDADTMPVKPAWSMIADEPRGVLYMRDRGLTNSMMCFCRPDDPLALEILAVAERNIASRCSSNVWSVTGPAVLKELYADPDKKHLFDGIRLISEEECAEYFKTVAGLDYKRGDDHWLVARDKGLSIFNDDAA